MRRFLATIAIVAFTSILVLRLGTLLSRPSPARTWLWLTWHRAARIVTGGPAPRVNCNVPEEIILPNSYSIILKSGYSLEQHKQAVGRGADLDAATEDVLDEPLPGFQTTYFAKIEDTSLLAAIRADPGVDFIECDVLQDFSTGWLVEEPSAPLQ